jgi:purine nucleosidase
MIRYHIDTDMGVDDGLALVHAHHLFGDSMQAVSTVFGNVPLQQATKNALTFRALLKSSWPVISGAASASDGFTRDATDVHGNDGLGGATHRFAPALLRQIPDAADATLASFRPPVWPGDKIRIIGLGPATNIPQLAECYGAANIDRIVLMAGVFFDVGNTTISAEFNAYCDPAALDDTLNLGIPVTLVPLDVCRKVQLSRSTISSYLQRDTSELTQLVVASHMSYMDFYRKSEGIDGCFPHDTLAVLVAINPDWFFRISAPITVDVTPSLRGKTTLRSDPSPSHVSVVTGGALKHARDLLADWPLRTGSPGS